MTLRVSREAHPSHEEERESHKEAQLQVLLQVTSKYFGYFVKRASQKLREWAFRLQEQGVGLDCSVHVLYTRSYGTNTGN